MSLIKHNLRHWYISIALVCTALLVGLSLFWTFYPYKNLKFGEYYVNAETYKPGDFVTVTISEFCTDGSANSVERWIDNNFGGVSLPPLRFNGATEPMCIKDLKALVRIPEETVPGQYRFEFITRYQPNPIRTVKVTTYTPYFYVTK